MEKSDNLTNVYLMPLLKINKNTFSKGNFVNSYLGKSTNKLIVKLKDGIKDEEKYCTHEYYENSYVDEKGFTIIIFKLPRKFEKTITFFRLGKFSKFDKESKDLIIKHSGLPYKRKTRTSESGKTVTITARHLAALEKSPSLKASLEQQLAVKLPWGAELISIPGEEVYYDL